MKRFLAAMDRRPWTLAALAALGATLLLCGALPLWASPDLLDLLIAQGDARLALGLGLVFAGSLLLFRVLLRHRPLPEEQVDEMVSTPPPPAQREEPARGSYLR